MSREPTGDRMASLQQQQALGTGVLSQEAGCPATGLDPEGGLARSRGCGVRREEPGRPSPRGGRTHSHRGLDQLWLVPCQQKSQVHKTRHGGLADPAETWRGEASCPRSYVTISHSAWSGSDTLNPGQETRRRLDKGRWQPFLQKYFSHTLP